jgi:phosphoribosylglycinamide formyltransferase-1
MNSGNPPMPVVALISGRGSNLQAIIAQADAIGIRIAAVISNVADAQGLRCAADAGIPVEVVNHQDYPDREHYDQALSARIDYYQPQLVILAGFMRILSAGFVKHYRGRLLNIHPSLLPDYRGLNTHQRVIQAGEREHGCTVHFVTEELDGGPTVVQRRVAINANDDAQSLSARVLQQEHQIYPLAIHWFAAGRLRLHGDQAQLDGNNIAPNGANSDSLGNAA